MLDNIDDMVDEDTETVQYWICEECGYIDNKKPMPKDRAKFYARKESPKCPKCHSVGFVPSGY
jgi:rubrerythrin